MNKSEDAAFAIFIALLTVRLCWLTRVGNGYVRSEAIVVLYLQKATASQRIYATVVNARTNTDGAKEQGITYPSGAIQRKLIEETYSEVNLNPADVLYVEAHGTGTKVSTAAGAYELRRLILYLVDIISINFRKIGVLFMSHLLRSATRKR